MKLEYDKSKDTVLRDSIGTYTVTSMYFLPDFKDKFVDLRSNLVDLNDALIKKCIVGTEQDFRMLMQKAKEYGKLRYIMFNQKTDFDKEIFGLNQDLLNDNVIVLED